jgi:hypothetical protein
MSLTSYKRNQVEWALWRSFMHGRRSGIEPPAVFRTRIKRLIELDKSTIPLKEEDGRRRAYLSNRPEGSGVDTPYEPIDVFCLAIGLELMNAGFKQGDVVFVCQHIRDQLERWFPRLLQRPSVIDRQLSLADKHPDLPAVVRAKGQRVVDARVFMIVSWIELDEVTLVSGQRPPGVPLVLEPEFLEGVGAMSERLDALMPLHRRTATVLEIAGLAQAVWTYLKAAPELKRGRPRTSS